MLSSLTFGRVGSSKFGRAKDQKERLCFRSKARARSFPSGISFISFSLTSTTSTREGRRSEIENCFSPLVAFAAEALTVSILVQDARMHKGARSPAVNNLFMAGCCCAGATGLANCVF